MRSGAGNFWCNTCRGKKLNRMRNKEETKAKEVEEEGNEEEEGATTAVVVV